MPIFPIAPLAGKNSLGEQIVSMILAATAAVHGHGRESYKQASREQERLRMAHDLNQTAAIREQVRGDKGENAQELVTKHLRNAQISLTQAYNTGFAASPLVQNIPAFQQMQKLQKDCAALMLEVSKLRGL